MKYKIVLLFSSFLLFISCSLVQESKPDYLIDEDKLVEIMIDLHKSDAILSRIKRSEALKKAQPTAYYKSIYEKHDISREKFEKNIEYYADHTVEFERLYTKVDEAFRKEKEANPAEEKEKIQK